MTAPELYERIGGSYGDARRILQTDKLIGKYIVKLLDDRSAEALFSAAEAHDDAALFNAAHTMKGVCGNLGLTSLANAASALAEEFRPGSARTMDNAEVERRVEALRADYARTLTGIRAFAAEQ